MEDAAEDSLLTRNLLVRIIEKAKKIVKPIGGLKNLYHLTIHFPFKIVEMINLWL